MQSMLRHIYTFLFYLILPLIGIRLLWRSLKQPGYRERIKERFGFYPKQFEKSLWIHAVSLGEVIAAMPMVEAFKVSHADLPIVVTTMTPTGAHYVKEKLKESVTHFYLPYDLPFAVKRFLKTIRPVGAIIMETELWPNLLTACAKAHLPLCLMNARLSQKSLRRYQWVRTGVSNIINYFSCIAVCSEEDAKRFFALGASVNQIHVTGNIKFDATIPDAVIEHQTHLKQLIGQDRLVWVAGSTHPGEEAIILKVHQAIREKHPTALLILAPRHPNRFEEVFALCEKNFTVARYRTFTSALTHDCAVLLCDKIGALLGMYSVSDVAFVGGSLIPHGGHNPIEPALFGKPILTGPHVFNFSDIASRFEAGSALHFVQDEITLLGALQTLLCHQTERLAMGARAKEVIIANRGVLARQLTLARQCLFDKL